MAFSANPEDYTNRGNIITPLKDRIDAQIITHYPKDIETTMKITAQESWAHREMSVDVLIPDAYKYILEQVAFEARASEYIDQKSGVSTRMTITAMEQMISAAERRALLQGEVKTQIRVSDLYHIIPALTGKLELVYEGEQEGAINVAKLIVGKAITKVYKTYFPDPSKRNEESASIYEPIGLHFELGNELILGDHINDNDYKDALVHVKGLKEAVANVMGESTEDTDICAWMDITLEALHQHSMLGKEEINQTTKYTDMLGTMLDQLDTSSGYEIE